MADNNPFPGENNTGHIWDDNIRELSNPPPTWWTIALWVSMLWVVVYMVLYPSLPIAHKAPAGVLGWTQMDEYKKGMEELTEVRAPYENKIAKMTVAEILADEELKNYISHDDGAGAGKVLFGDFCSACHGSAGQGGPSFPVLADDDWLFGGDIATIEFTITNGRKGVMTAHGKIMTADEISTLAKAVVDKKLADEPLYQSKGCFACHGPDAKGMTVLGSANLTDGIYRFVGEQPTMESVVYTITHGVNDQSDAKSREAVMPTFKDRLSADEIKKLAVYVYQMGGGQ